MKNDLSKCKVGDWIWTISSGWVNIYNISTKGEYEIFASDYDKSYTADGKANINDKYPSAFTEPPEGFGAEPKPVKIVKKWRWAIKYGDNLSKITDLYWINPPSTLAVKLPWTQIEVEE